MGIGEVFSSVAFNIIIVDTNIDCTSQFSIVWNENISCYINEQEMSQPSVISVLQMQMRVPKNVIQHMLPPITVIAEELGECND